MRKYQVMIDDLVSTASFSLDELLEMGLLDDYDEHIKVRASGETTWTIARDYPFHLSEVTSADDVIFNADGRISRKKSESDSKKYTIDEYGQVIRQNYAGNQFALSSETLHFGEGESSQRINVTSNMSWRISLASASWVHVTTSDNSLTVRVDKNTSNSSRHDYFRLKSGDEEKTINVYQSSNHSSSDDNGGCFWALIVIIILIIAFL